MKIRDIDFGKQPVFLAPMEDVTDPAFRILCKEFGAEMVYSEFVSADALIRNVNRSLEKIRVQDEERPVAVQIYGRDVESMVEAARMVEAAAHPDVLDINFGCPVKKIATKGAGAGLLQDPPRLLAITRAVVDAVGAEVPVTVKTRLGWDMEHRIIITLAEELQDCGIDALTIHGRTRSQLYTDHADWTLIGQARANPRMRIPIIGNGDIHSVAEADSAFDRYGVDAVMIGRATFGQPWVFARRTFTTDEKLDILRQQVLASVERLDEYRGILHSRRHLAASPLFKGIPDFRQKRIDMLRADTVESLFAILDDIRPLLAES